MIKLTLRKTSDHQEDSQVRLKVNLYYVDVDAARAHEGLIPEGEQEGIVELYASAGDIFTYDGNGEFHNDEHSTSLEEEWYELA